MAQARFALAYGQYMLMGGAGVAGTAASHPEVAQEAEQAIVNEIEEIVGNGGCFVAGTPLQMADGRHKPIEQAKKGEQVQSRDAHTGQRQNKRIQRVTVRKVAESVQVSLAARPQGRVVETITTTREHPFAVDGKGFVPAGRLHIGNAVVTRAGPPLFVTEVSVQHPVGGVLVYNLTVADTHTYFVGNTNGGTWVHNVDCPLSFQLLTPGEDLSQRPELVTSPYLPTQSEISSEAVNERALQMVQNPGQFNWTQGGGQNQMTWDPSTGGIVEGHHRFIPSLITGISPPEGVISTGPLEGDQIPIPWSKVRVY